MRGDDIGVMQLGGDLSFAQYTLPEVFYLVRVRKAVQSKLFDGDGAIEYRVVRLVDVGNAPEPTLDWM